VHCVASPTAFFFERTGEVRRDLYWRVLLKGNRTNVTERYKKTGKPTALHVG
jgi:hypothetical protein